MLVTSSIIMYCSALCGVIKKKSKSVLVWIAIICFVMAWLTKDPDSANYEIFYNSVKSGNYGRVSAEPIYVFLMQIGCRMGLNYIQFRFCYNLLSILALIYALKEYTSAITFCIAIGLIYPLPLFFELQRSFLASAIIIYAFRFLTGSDTKHMVKYLLCVAVAGFIQNSNFFFLIIPLFKIIKNRKYLFAFIGMSVIIALLLADRGILVKYISMLPLSKSISGILSRNSTYKFGGRLILGLLRIISATIPGFLSVRYYRARKATGKISGLDDYMDLVFSIDIMALMLLIPLFYASNSGRLVYVFSIFNYTAVANVANSGFKSIRRVDMWALLIVLITLALAIGNLFFQINVTGKGTSELTYFSHFETNPIFVAIDDFFNIF